MFPIDKDVPFDPVRDSRAKYPFKIMQVGDSFAVSYSRKNLMNLHSAAMRASKRLGREFKVRTRLLDDGSREIRCWRLK